MALAFAAGERLSALELGALASRLEAAAGRPVDPAAWWLGFRLSLRDLLVNRLSMYALAHRVRPQRFLPRVLQTWQALDQLSPDPEPTGQEARP